MTRLPHLALSLAGLSLLGGCAGVPSGTQPVGDFQLERYYGQWHEIARLPEQLRGGTELRHRRLLAPRGRRRARHQSRP